MVMCYFVLLEWPICQVPVLYYLVLSLSKLFPCYLPTHAWITSSTRFLSMHVAGPCRACRLGKHYNRFEVPGTQFLGNYTRSRIGIEGYSLLLGYRRARSTKCYSQPLWRNWDGSTPRKQHGVLHDIAKLAVGYPL